MSSNRKYEVDQEHNYLNQTEISNFWWKDASKQVTSLNSSIATLCWAPWLCFHPLTKSITAKSIDFVTILTGYATHGGSHSDHPW